MAAKYDTQLFYCDFCLLEIQTPQLLRYYVNKKHRITNTYLENTDLGRKLERALERQARGKDVGDGGM